MKKILSTALLSAVLLPGCIISSGSNDDDDGVIDYPDAGEVIPEAFGTLEVTWLVTPGCPNADDAAEVIALERTTNEMHTTIFDCAALGGVTAEMPLGTYDVWVEITTADGSGLLAQSLTGEAILSTDGEQVTVDLASFPTDAGFFGLTWALLDGAANPLTCAEVGGAGVDIVATHATTSEALVDVFDCEAGEGVSGEMPLGLYTLVVDVLDENDAALGSSVAREETVTFGNELVDLGNFDFTFE